MTEQEAIDYFNNVTIDTSIGLKNITTTTELINISIKALEKQIPKKVIFVHPLQEDNGGDYMCPTCKRGTVYNAYGDKSLHCPYCGQALEWE